jgi:hypothetical protein
MRYAKKKSRPLRFRRGNWLKWRYGITHVEFDEMVQRQNNRCAICSDLMEDGGTGHKARVVDHCHMTKKVRGILCSACNRGIGHFDDRPEALTAAAEYIKKHGRRGRHRKRVHRASNVVRQVEIPLPRTA